MEVASPEVVFWAKGAGVFVACITLQRTGRLGSSVDESSAVGQRHKTAVPQGGRPQSTPRTRTAPPASASTTGRLPFPPPSALLPSFRPSSPARWRRALFAAPEFGHGTGVRPVAQRIQKMAGSGNTGARHYEGHGILLPTSPGESSNGDFDRMDSPGYMLHLGMSLALRWK